MTSQQTGGLSPSRRTLVKGAAWSVPVVAVGAKASFAAASCIPQFIVLPTSQKCCSGQIKSYKLDILIQDASGCVAAGEEICIESVLPDTGNPSVAITEFGGDGTGCTVEGGTVTVYLYDVSVCTVNLVIGFSIDGGDTQYTGIKADNITDAVDCPILPPSMQP